jgi:hypothetical protein
MSKTGSRRDHLEDEMRSRWLGLLSIIACMFASSGAAFAGVKHIHDMDVKAQCIAKADTQNLTGHERHVAIKQCRHEGSYFSLTGFLGNPH